MWKHFQFVEFSNNWRRVSGCIILVKEEHFLAHCEVSNYSGHVFTPPLDQFLPTSDLFQLFPTFISAQDYNNKTTFHQPNWKVAITRYRLELWFTTGPRCYSRRHKNVISRSSAPLLSPRLTVLPDCATLPHTRWSVVAARACYWSATLVLHFRCADYNWILLWGRKGSTLEFRCQRAMSRFGSVA